MRLYAQPTNAQLKIVTFYGGALGSGRMGMALLPEDSPSSLEMAALTKARHICVTVGRRKGRMLSSLTSQSIERWIGEQEQLAAIAACDEVRAMHLELIALFRTQLACLRTADLLAPPAVEICLDRAA